MTQQADPLSVLGKSGPNLDAYERVTGLAKYTGDLELPGMLVARVLRSPHAHARIVSIDTSRAEALQGVKAVVTHKDAPKVMVWGSRQYLLNDRVRFAGEAVAAVAAVDSATAETALGLIQVQYDVLPFVIDPEAAMAPTAPRLFEDGNQEGEPRLLTRGDIAMGLAESDRVIERDVPLPHHVERRHGAARCHRAMGTESPDGLGLDAGALSHSHQPGGTVQPPR